jgi:hypothetical protein
VIFVFYPLSNSMANKTILVSAFFGLMILGFALRMYHIGSYSLFGDEKQSMMIAVGNINIGGMYDLMQPGKTFTPADFWAPRGIVAWFDADARGDVSGNSLVHDMLLKFVAFLFGKSDASVRSISVVFNMLTVWIMFYWSRRIYSKITWQIALLAFAVIEPFFIVYSQQARNYATSMFFATASNFFYWKILYPRSEQGVRSKDWVAWVLTSILALFSTYLTALILLGQGLFALANLKSKEIWSKLIWGAVLICVPFLAWMTLGPGQYFLAYQADAGAQYLAYLEANGPIPGWIEAANVGNLGKRTVMILSDLFFWTNDLYAKQGYKVGGIALVLFGYGIFTWLKALPPERRRFYIFGLIQIFLPIFVLISTAINAGTTTGYFIRYASFGLPFGIFISVGFMEYLFKKPIWIRLIAGLFVFIQAYFLILSFLPLYADKAQKYTFSVGRIQNPYILIAKKLQASYAPGDTVLYPSQVTNFLNSKHLSGGLYSVADAQLVNLYLSPEDKFIQRIDTLQKDSVILKRKNGNQILIFDFKQGKFRY